MFAVVGRMVYARTHTRDLLQLSDMSLSKAIPFAAATFVLAGMASMGLPGFSGFVAELMILIGTWRSYPLLAVFVGLGIVVGVVYIWRAMQKAFFREPALAPLTSPPPTPPPLPPITLPERIGAVLLIAASIIVGLYPQLLLNLIQPALNSPLFAPLRFGSWQ
jgi:NADH-quinone oxidoreductase subunit M